ncbi:MAG: uncharacterized protein KVP18_003634 [Porospora cf. gigantea A]|uniref:uncharacterized protein n=1 Tax=Porospora cf. gigantea A TaxID=2853593 RepID=UPI00355A3907|nr:MAG: hypothetical protein KVP18_003634 [Porospora cf. gigantea A]
MLTRRVLFLGTAAIIGVVLFRTRPPPEIFPGSYYLHRFSTAYGWGDNLISLANSFRFSQELNRTFLLDFHSAGREDAWFTSFFVPRDLDWSTTNISCERLARG